MHRLETTKLSLFVVGLAVLLLAPLSGAQEIPRMPNGKPDLSGTYNIATLTPVERPRELGDRLSLTPEEAEALAEKWKGYMEKGAEKSDPNRSAPEVGGSESLIPEFAGAGGGTGGYNAFWLGIGDSAFELDGKIRTSILTDPPNGRYPEMTPEARAERRKRYAAYAGVQRDSSTAWWIDLEQGPYDDPESMGRNDRCLLSFGSGAGPPILPNYFYNMYKRIIQTDDHLMVLSEMVHDVRVVRIGDTKHDTDAIRKWHGDSIAHWDGDELVIETVNFRDETPFSSGSRNMKVTERISRLDSRTLRYRFTVEDPSVFTAPFSGEMPWPQVDDQIYEYACHEGNYAMGGILRGARILEKEALAKKKGESPD